MMEQKEGKRNGKGVAAAAVAAAVPRGQFVKKLSYSYYDPNSDPKL